MEKEKVTLLKHRRHDLLKAIARDISELKKSAAAMSIHALIMEKDMNTFLEISTVLEEGKDEC